MCAAPHPAETRRLRSAAVLAHGAILAFFGKFLLVCAVLVLAAGALSSHLAQALLPLFRAEIAWFGDYRIDDLSVGREGADQVLRLQAGLAHPLTLNGRTFTPDPRGRATATTLVGNVSVPMIVLTATALAWPVRRSRCYAWRAAALLPALLIMVMLVAPFLLLGSIWGLLVEVADPGRFSPLLLWCDGLESGGAAAIAAALGVCVAWLTQDSWRNG